MTIRTALALFLAMTVPALADEAGCRALLAQAPAGNVTAGGVTAIGDDGCDFTDLHVQMVPRTGWTARHLIATRLDFKALQAQQMPRSLRLVAHDVVFAPRLPNPVTTYVLGLNARPFEVTLDLSGPDAEGTLTLGEFSMRGRTIGDVRLSGVLVHVDPDVASGDPALAMSAGLQSLTLHMDNQGFFESYVATSLAPSLLQDSTDPQATVSQLKTEAIAVLRRTLSATGTTPATIDALARFVSDLPHPDKVLDLSLRPTAPIGLAEGAAIASGDPQAAARLLPAGALTASYGP